jgi:dTDP-4-dehydrorhamnose 3,5-epimerase
MHLKITGLSIEGLVLSESHPFQDHRGVFYRAFCDRELDALLQGKPIRQINISRTETRGAIRGLHFQSPPAPEMKLIRCLQGRVWDVTVDLRCGSSTFLQWQSVELSGKTTAMVIIPEGCAHGFQVLEAGSELLYLHTSSYAPNAEGGVRYDDPQLKISWPLPVSDLSQRDNTHPFLPEDFEGIRL